MTGGASAANEGRFEAALEQSRVVDFVCGAGAEVQRALETSATTRTVRRLRVTALAWSPIKRLTEPPEQRTVVIDVTESRLLGPFVGPTARLRGVLASQWRRARVRHCPQILAAAVRASPIRAASLLVVYLLGLSVAMSWGRASPEAIGGVTMLAGVVILGLRDDRSWEDIRETKSISLLSSVVTPPDEG